MLSRVWRFSLGVWGWVLRVRVPEEVGWRATVQGLVVKSAGCGRGGGV